MKKIKCFKNKKNLFIFLFFSIHLWAIETIPKNIFLEQYELIPPLGRVKSIATSNNRIFAISDNYLLIFDKNNLKLTRTTYFSKEILLAAYDQFYDELWISSTGGILRYNINLGSIREYSFSEYIHRIGITPDKIYISASNLYSLERQTGKFVKIDQPPKNVIWFKGFNEKELKAYKFLVPYYYQDNLNETNEPFHRYEITAFYDDGMYLYVGTNQYGILRYNKYSWEKQRIIYGPLPGNVIRVRRFNDNHYFISNSGVSVFNKKNQSWQYYRMKQAFGDIVVMDNQFIVSYGNQLTKITGPTYLPLSQFKNSILSLGLDETNIYVGTANGMYRLYKETNEPLEFGPNRYGVYVIQPTPDYIFVGGEFALYSYNRSSGKWHQIFNRGVKDISVAMDVLYFLTVDNQLVQYNQSLDSIQSDSTTIILPYFNIYDLDTDGSMVYCATPSGLDYFNPQNQMYYPIYSLPRIKYNYVAVIDDYIYAISDKNIYRLAIELRN